MLFGTVSGVMNSDTIYMDYDFWITGIFLINPYYYTKYCQTTNILMVGSVSGYNLEKNLNLEILDKDKLDDLEKQLMKLELSYQ